MDRFIRKMCSDSQDGVTDRMKEIQDEVRRDEEELKDRYIWSFERRDGMSWEDYQELKQPRVSTTKPKYIYESPDGGETVTRREFGKSEKEVVKHPYDRSGDFYDRMDEEFGVDKEREIAEAKANFIQKRNEMLWNMPEQERADELTKLDNSDYFSYMDYAKNKETEEKEPARYYDWMLWKMKQLDKEEEEALLAAVDPTEMVTFGELSDDFDAEREQTRDAIDMAVDPGHYKGVACGKEYMELMVEMLDGYNGVEAHLLGQVYKYSMRLGKKDLPEQDAKKIAWYAAALAYYYKHGDLDAKTISRIIGQI